MKASNNDAGTGRPKAPQGDVARYAWKEQAYPAPSPSKKKIEWKASAILGLQWLAKADVTGHPITVVVPAVYNVMPAEAVALGWFNEIDALTTIRQRMIQTAKLTGWDLFTFHTRHNLDSFYSSTIAAVRQTWLSEGTLKPTCVAETVKQYGPVYEYNRVPARLVESLVFQSSLMGWLNARAEDIPLRYHVVGTALMSALVSSGSLSFDNAVKIAMHMGTDCDTKLTSLAEDQLKGARTPNSKENIGWERFKRVRQLLEGRAKFSMKMSVPELPSLEAPTRPFWFSATAGSQPTLIATVNDVRLALDSMDLASWSPALPKALPAESRDRIHGWLVSPMHPSASACRWSVYNFLLSTPESALLFLDHIAALGRRPAMAPRPDESQERFRVARMKTARL